MTPPLSSLMGTTSSAAVLRDINSDPGAVVFGSERDPLADRFRYMMNTVIQPLVQTQDVMHKVVQQVQVVDEAVDTFKAIREEEDLYTVPESMHEAILMYEPVRKLHKEGRIHAYGLEYGNMPKEDHFGRLINNGTIEYDGGVPETDIEFVWDMISTDPNLSDEELEAIRDTRSFLNNYIARELAKGGSRRDPTDPSNKIRK